jgi:hypothetical protein
MEINRNCVSAESDESVWIHGIAGCGKMDMQSKKNTYNSLALILLSALLPVIGQTVTVVPAYAAKGGIGSPVTAATHSQSTEHCPALPIASGKIVNVASARQLKRAVNRAGYGDTILLADGTYNMKGISLHIDTPNVTLRSASGNRDAVILDGQYKSAEIIQIVASDVTIADITLREARHHPVHVMTKTGDTLNTLIYNVHIIDPGQQAIKINPAKSGYPDKGTIACSHIEITDAGRPVIRNNCYTGGIDAHKAHGWTIRDNLIEGFWCSKGLSEHAVHMWDDSSDSVVERNRLVDNARGVGFGMGKRGHTGGIIRNNMIHTMQDVGIGLETAPDAKVYNNTIITDNYANSIEYRFATTSGIEIINNATNRRIHNRKGGKARIENNMTHVQSNWFMDAANGDLHLVSDRITSLIDRGRTLGDVSDDFDGDTRPFGSAFDIGADEYTKHAR